MFIREGELFRGLDATAAANWRQFSRTRAYRDLLEAGDVVQSSFVPADVLEGVANDREWAAVLRHEVLPFISHPFEWSASRLRDAALFHLRLMKAALDEDFILKDASAYNVQWIGSRPVFIDTPSFEPLEPGTPWVGYRQFCEMFLNPLLLQAYKGVSFQPLLRGRIDGIPTQQASRMMSFRDLFRRGVFTHVYLHARLQTGLDASSTSSVSLKQAGFSKEMIVANVRGLHRTIDRLDFPYLSRSGWTDYGDTHSYDAAEYAAKKAFVGRVTEKHRPRIVWDLGCNTGDFSLIAAEHAELVVALDQDEAAVDLLYRRTRDAGVGNVLALVMDLADPSPGLGWNLKERLPLAERGAPDLVIFLALLHHLAVTANVPLADVVEYIRSVSSEAIVEFVSPEDEQVRRLTRNKPPSQYRDYSRKQFEHELTRHFRVLEVQEVKAGLRWLYHLRASA